MILNELIVHLLLCVCEREREKEREKERKEKKKGREEGREKERNGAVRDSEESEFIIKKMA